MNCSETTEIHSAVSRFVEKQLALTNSDSLQWHLSEAATASERVYLAACCPEIVAQTMDKSVDGG